MIQRSGVGVSFLVAAVVLLVQGPARGDVAAPAARAPAVHAASRVPPSSPLAVGASFVIEPPMADYVRELDSRELREQIRDWAVVGTLTRLGATTHQLAASTYQTPPARLRYLDDLYTFEYGRGRRAYLGDRVLLFRDKEDHDPETTLGRLADAVRMENGEIPASVEIYLIDDRRDEGTIKIERAADLTRAQLFSSDYGYSEADVTSARELSAWLQRIDDLTFARLASDGTLRLGGRRFPTTRTANVSSEDVAAIYQAHALLAKRRTDALATVNSLAPYMLGILRSARSGGKAPARDKGDERAMAALMKLPRAQRDQVLRALPIVADEDPSPGFSLDPKWLPDPDHPDHPLVVARLHAFAADPCAELQRISARAAALVRKQTDDTRRTSPTVVGAQFADASSLSPTASLPPAVCQVIKDMISPVLNLAARALDDATPESWDRALSVYHRLVETLHQQTSDDIGGATAQLTAAALDFNGEDSKVQCARYEGTAGTEVGMTLFYTDLLAKLWMIDFGRSAPIATLPGFLSQPHMDLPPSYKAEVERNPYTRLWFGARANGVSRDGSGRNAAFLFDHRFSRVYAAGSNPGTPGLEVQPSEASRRALAWWDRHFDEIADYEPQYHRQNQIMKWALVTASLAGTPLGDQLADLPVARGNSFASWQQANRAKLRFGEALPAVTQQIAGLECIPLLSSYPYTAYGTSGRHIIGGVTTLGRAASRAIPVTNAGRALGTRLPLVADLAAGARGSATRIQAVLEGDAVTFRNAALAKVRTAAGDVRIGTPSVRFARGATRDSLAIRAGQGRTAIGELGTELRDGRVAMQWTDGAVERARLGKPELGAQSLATADRAAKLGNLVDAARMYERALPAQLSEVDRLAREAIVDIARRRPAALVARLERLAAEGKQLSPQARDALLGSVARESPAVARRLDTVLRTGEPLTTAETSLAVERGHILVTRDLEQLPRRAVPAPETDLSMGVVYVDVRLRIGQEGLLPDVGGPAARWTHQRGVKLVELKASAIGELPDRIVERSTGVAVERATGGTLPRMPASPPVFLLQQCDADHQTATTRDDC